MSWLGAIKGFFGGGNIIDTAVNAADSFHLSGEERNDFLVQFTPAIIATDPARRVLAFGIGIVWIEMTQIVAYLLATGGMTADIGTLYMYVCGVFGTVCAFYFYTGKKRKDVAAPEFKGK